MGALTLCTILAAVKFILGTDITMRDVFNANGLMLSEPWLCIRCQPVF